MMIAQRLYEGVDLGEEGTVGLITYMRTDSPQVSNDAMAEVRELIGKEYGKEFLPGVAEHLQVEEERAGGARSHSPDVGCRGIRTRSSSISRKTSTRFTSSSGSASSPRR